MKSLKSSLAAKATAIVLLVAMLIFLAASVAGIVVLVGNDSYLDNGTRLKNTMLSSVVCRAEEECYPLLDTLAEGNTDSAAYHAMLEYYNERFAPENSNLRIEITDENGKLLFENRQDTAIVPETQHEYGYSIAIGESYHTFLRTFENEEAMYEYLNEMPERIVSHSFEENSAGKLEATITTVTVQNRPLTIRVAVMEKLTAEDECFRAVELVNRLVKLQRFLLPVAIAALVFAAALFIFLLCAAGHKAGVEGIHLNWVDRIPFDLYLAVLTAGFIGSAALFAELFSYGTFMLWQLAAGGAVILLWAFLLLSPILSFATRAKAGKWWKNTVIYFALYLLWKALRWVGHGIRFVCTHLPLCWKTVLICAGLTLVELIFLLARVYPLLWVLEKLLFVPLVILIAINLQTLKTGGARIAEGDMNYRVNVRHMLPDFRHHGENLNSISVGMQKAVEVQMRSERMKAELITNVSHDIKTPLTSIVNYVNLLQAEGLDSPNAPEYLRVLDRQSLRLKKLTEDLVEASKASTGNIAVHAEKTDVNVLLTQAAGEYEEKLKAQELELLLDLKVQGAYVFADGRLLWRVIDNLLGNICKYSLERTRVYLQTAEQEGNLIITFKNISRDALNISSDELMERFVRGDASRNTEGSGLGLSIARSLTELQGGRFTICIDGDLFKAEVSFPLMKE